MNSTPLNLTKAYTGLTAPFSTDWISTGSIKNGENSLGNNLNEKLNQENYSNPAQLPGKQNFRIANSTRIT